jgi:aminoglycoside phosphotransferase (APT) family kinase protein
VGSLRDLPLSPVLARHARVTIEAWIEGRPLSELPRTSVRLAAAADVLGRLHATRRVGRRDLGGRAVTRPFADDLARRLEALHQEGAVTATESDVITRALGRLRPPRARTGLTHNDFCAENIVEDVAGRLQVVDNGGLRPGFLDFDLARCWYRWPMPAPAWRTFLAAYRRRRATTAGCEHERFWRLAAIVRSAHFRVVRASPDAALPLVRLRRFAREESAP